MKDLMVHLKKKIRVEPSHTNSSVSTTHTGQTLQDLLNWLSTCGTLGLEDGRFDFRNSTDECGGSLGGFAARNFAIGDVLFSIPLSCLISISNSNDSKLTKLVRDAAVAFGDSKLVTSELLIWLYMIQQLADSDGHFHAFVRSLDSQSPSPLSWPDNLTAALLGTNMSTMTNSSSSVERHSQFLDDVRIWASENGRDCSFIGADSFNITSLIWARGHYLARRYPGTFSSCESYEKSLMPSTTDVEQIDTSVDGREQGMMNLGALVPLLDILNHNPEREWLTFKVSDGFLHVTCNYPIEKGSEIYSNYGSLSNEMLLYAYGFCLETNLDDAVTLQLMGLDLGKGKHSHL
jgi:SET domain